MRCGWWRPTRCASPDNADAFLPEAENAIGYPIEIISGEEEGRLIYLGVACSLANPGERRLVLDIGGGSTELIIGKGLDILLVDSFSTGTVRQSDGFFIDGRIDAASFDAAIMSARGYFEDAASLYKAHIWDTAYGSSGTLRAISEAIAKNGLGDGRLTLASLGALKQRLIEFGSIAAIQLPGMKADRAPVLVGGLAILIAVMQELDIARHAADRGRPAHGRAVGPAVARHPARPARTVGARLPATVPGRRVARRPHRRHRRHALRQAQAGQRRHHPAAVLERTAARGRHGRCRTAATTSMAPT